MPDGTRLTKHWYKLHYSSTKEARRSLQRQFNAQFHDWHPYLYRAPCPPPPRDAMLTGILVIEPQGAEYSIYIYPGPKAKPTPREARALPRARYSYDDPYDDTT